MKGEKMRLVEIGIPEERTGARTVLAPAAICVFVFALLLALAVGAIPATALASSLEVGSQVGLSTQAKMRTVHVLSSATTTYDGRSQEDMSVCTYYKNGLLKKEAWKGRSSSGSGWKTSNAMAWTYDKNGSLLSAKGNDESWTFKTNGGGYLTKGVCVYMQGCNKEVLAYKASSGRVKSVAKSLYTKWNGPWEKAGTAKYAYTYKNGKLNVESYSIGSNKGSKTFSYDAKGNLAKMKDSDGSTLVLKNTYDPLGRLQKSAKTGSMGSSAMFPSTTTYKFKTIKVSERMAEKVEAQQWALLNMNINFALGGHDLTSLIMTTTI